MTRELEVQSLTPRRLTPEDRRAWTQWRAERPDLASPYFDVRYALAMGEAASWARVAIIRRDGRTVGYLPFQRRSGRLQPLGAPLTDYHGVIAPAAEEIDLAEVVRLLGARRFRFTGLVGPAGQAAVNPLPRRRMSADLRGGYEAYLAGRAAGFAKDKRRRLRALEREHGSVDFRLGPASPESLARIVALKRRQMSRTGQVDVLAKRWPVDLLGRLAAAGEPDFGLWTAELHAAGQLVAAEAGLRSGDIYHLWFPVYDRNFARYSPGVLMTLLTLQSLAETGVTCVDFGLEGEAYKRDLASPVDTVTEGDVMTGPLQGILLAALRRTLRLQPRLNRTAKRLALLFERRFDRIRALSPEAGLWGAGLLVLISLGLRWPGVSLAVAAAGLALSGAAVVLAD